jgi:uncharacterized membrane protein YccC
VRNFTAYAASLAVYTATIFAIYFLGPVGASDTGSVVILAIDRALEICIGIVCAGVVLALTDLGHSRRKLATEFANLSAAIMDGFADCFVAARSSLDQFRAVRRELLRRVIALDPMMTPLLGKLPICASVRGGCDGRCLASWKRYRPGAELRSKSN